MTPAGILAAVLTGSAWCAIALADRRARRRRQEINRMAAGRRQAPAAPEPMPRRQKVTYPPAVPLRPDQEDEFAALVFAYRYVNIPEPAERRSR